MSDAPNSTPESMIARQIGPNAVGVAGFLKWLQVSMPAVYRDIKPQLIALNIQAKAQAGGTGLGSLGDSGSFTDLNPITASVSVLPGGTGNASNGWADAAGKLIAAWGQYKLTDAQLEVAKNIANVNLERAKQGLAPIPYDASQLGLAPTVNVGLSGNLSNLALWGGAGVLGFLVLNSVLKHGRR